MKYITENKQNVDKYSELTPLYDKLIAELDIYKDFCEKVWFGYKPISSVFEVSFVNFINKKCVTTLLCQSIDDKTRIYIKIDENSVLFHFFYINDKEKEKQDRNWNVYNVLVNFDFALSERGILLDKFKDSKEKGYKPILNVYESFGELDLEYLNSGNKINILDNLFPNTYNYLSEFTDKYFKLIPYFIYFGTDDAIKEWWSRVQNTKHAYKLANFVKNSDQYNKFKNIIGDVDMSDELFSIGFADD